MFDVFVGVSINQKIFSKVYPRVFNELSSNKLLDFRDKIRNQYGTIIVGGNTVKVDNPNLLNKNNSNIRIIIDKYGNLDLNSKVFVNKPEKTYLILLRKNTNYIEELKRRNIKVILLIDANETKILETIKKISVGKVLVEGGGKTISFFLKNDCIDNIKMIKFPFLLSSDSIDLFDKIEKTIFLKLKESFIIENKFIYEEYEIKRGMIL